GMGFNGGALGGEIWKKGQSRRKRKAERQARHRREEGLFSCPWCVSDQNIMHASRAECRSMVPNDDVVARAKNSDRTPPISASGPAQPLGENRVCCGAGFGNQSRRHGHRLAKTHAR